MSGVSNSCSCQRAGCITIQTVLAVVALGAIVVGVLSVLAQEKVLSDAWDLIGDKTWSHITWASGTTVLIGLGLWNWYFGSSAKDNALGGIFGGLGAPGSGGSGTNASVNPNPQNTRSLDAI